MKQTKRSELSMTIGRELEDLAFIRQKTMTVDEVFAAFDQAETKLMALVQDDPELLLETRRRCAEHRFGVACARHIALEKVEQLHQRLVELGFTNIERRTHVEIQLAREYARVGKSSVARERLNRVLVEIESSTDTARALLKSLSASVKASIAEL